jgi:hypothetical protein
MSKRVDNMCYRKNVFFHCHGVHYLFLRQAQNKMEIPTKETPIFYCFWCVNATKILLYHLEMDIGIQNDEFKDKIGGMPLLSAFD